MVSPTGRKGIFMYVFYLFCICKCLLSTLFQIVRPDDVEDEGEDSSEDEEEQQGRKTNNKHKCS